MVAIGATGSTPWWIFAVGFAFAIFWGVYNAYLVHRQRERKHKNELMNPVNKEIDAEKRMKNDLSAGWNNGSSGNGNLIVHPKFRTLYGRKPLIGVIVGLGIIIGNVLFFSFVIPARTSGEIITTIALVIAGVAIAAFSNLFGLMRVSRARRNEGEGSESEEN